MNKLVTRCFRFGAIILAAFVLSSMLCATAEEQPKQIVVTVDMGAEGKQISPYIYGINLYGNENNLSKVTVHALRQGGNRMTAYNWETNASNAGSDWKHSSDTHLSVSTRPGDQALRLSGIAKNFGIAYTMTTLQLAGYVSADTKGSVAEAETAPSSRWLKVMPSKDGPFTETPDLTDGAVYMDEYVHYLTQKIGGAGSETGIRAYSLDNEPALWHNTHSRVHPEPVAVSELIEKSVATAAAVKAIDPDAEIFGPAVYGYTAYDHLADDDKSSEWETLKRQGRYHWFLDCYLDLMRQAGEEAGMRLLDVLDIHYYSESARVSPEDRVQSVRTLYEKGFAENSWIGQWCQVNIPILPTIRKSIDTYYPGTRLAITEYNFGGENDLSGTIAEVEALGCFADQEVYFASLWGGGKYIFSGINLYTDYDGNGHGFGDRLLPTESEDVSLVSGYAAVFGDDHTSLTATLTNKSFTDPITVILKPENTETLWQEAQVWAVYGDTPSIRRIEEATEICEDGIFVTLPPLCAAMVVLTGED